MGLKWSIENIQGWETRYAAVLRWRDRVRGCIRENGGVSADSEDFILAFFIFCFSLCDFVKSTGGVSGADMKKLVDDNKFMRICRDICNRSKHYKITPPHQPSIDATWSLGREYVPPDGYKNFLIVGGDKLDPVDVVHGCVAFWDQLIATGQVAKAPAPF